jgi:hypothetical protein
MCAVADYLLADYPSVGRLRAAYPDYYASAAVTTPGPGSIFEARAGLSTAGVRVLVSDIKVTEGRRSSSTKAPSNGHQPLGTVTSPESCPWARRLCPGSVPRAASKQSRVILGHVPGAQLGLPIPRYWTPWKLE